MGVRDGTKKKGKKISRNPEKINDNRLHPH